MQLLQLAAPLIGYLDTFLMLCSPCGSPLAPSGGACLNTSRCTLGMSVLTFIATSVSNVSGVTTRQRALRDASQYRDL